MKLIDCVRVRTVLAPVLGGLLFGAPLAAQTPSPPAAQYPALPSETPAKFVPATDSFDYVRRDVMIPMRDGVKLHTVILVPKGAKGAPILLTRTPYDATKLTSHAQSAHLGPDPERLRQRHRGDRRGRLHPRGPGRARQVRLRGRLRDEPPAARAAEPDAGRSRHRHLRHHRLAGEERPGEQRPGRHPRHLLRRLPALDGARQSPPGAQGGRADEPDGRRLDGRRLVPQRRLPPAEHGLHLRPGGGPQVGDQVVDEPLRRLRHVHAGGIGGRARASPRARAGRLLAEDPRASELRRLLARPGGGQGPGGPAAEGAGDAGPQPLGPGGHLRRHRRLQGARAEGHGQRQGVPGHGPLVSRPGDRGRQHAGRLEIRQRYRRSISAGRSCARSWTSTSRTARPRPTCRPSRRSRPGRTRGGACPPGRPAAPSGCTIRPTPLYLAAGLKLGFAAPKPGDAGVRGIRLRPRQARAVPRPPHSARRLRERPDLVAMARGRPARGVRPPGRRWRSSPTS